MPNWQESYRDLEKYIEGNPAVEISPSAVAIPASSREEFYRYFDRVRLDFINELHPGLLEKAAPLSESLTLAMEELKTTLGLSEIKLKGNLRWFAKDPQDGMFRLLYNPLFDLLKGKLDTDDFEEEASAMLSSAFTQLFRVGYQHWILISLVNLENPQKAMVVPLYGSQEDYTLVGGGEPAPGTIEEEVSKPEETKILNLDHPRDAAYITPDLIFYSTLLECYASIRGELFSPERMVKNTSRWVDWITYRKVGVRLTHNFAADMPDIVLHTNKSTGNLALIADFARFARPDISIESMEADNWYTPEALEKIRRSHDFLNPRLGTFVISRTAVPEEVQKQLLPHEPQPVSDEHQGEQPPAEAAAEPENELPTSQESEHGPEKAQDRTVEETGAQPEAGAAENPPTEAAPEQQGPGIKILTAGYDTSNLGPIIEALRQYKNPPQPEVEP